MLASSWAPPTRYSIDAGVVHITFSRQPAGCRLLPSARFLLPLVPEQMLDVACCGAAHKLCTCHEWPSQMASVKWPSPLRAGGPRPPPGWRTVLVSIGCFVACYELSGILAQAAAAQSGPHPWLSLDAPLFASASKLLQPLQPLQALANRISPTILRPSPLRPRPPLTTTPATTPATSPATATTIAPARQPARPEHVSP